MNEDKICIKRLKVQNKTLQEQYDECFEEWVAYWRANPHRFIIDYLGLTLYDFQQILIYQMNINPNYLYVASRGLAKSTLTLLFCIQRAILYPGQKILVVCPVKSQSRQFIKKIYEFIKVSPNLEAEIEVKDIKTGVNESSIPFKNGSTIFSAPYSENSLGIRTHILIIDEFVRTDKEVITRVFDPMLSDSRKPPYLLIDKKERYKYYEKEELRKLYLSSIRRADEWSYQTLEEYVDYMTDGNPDYGVAILPYQFGVKNGFISKKKVEQVFRENSENIPILRAEYLAIPERGTGNSYFTFNMFDKVRTNDRALYSMSDEEYPIYKDNPQKWKFYQEKLSNEIRILAVDIALVESKNNDNTSIWILRLIPDGGRYKKILAYGESIHGINSIVQTKRIKQLFYELQCDYAVIDTQGSGIGIFDISTAETYDEARGITYPAWTVINFEDVKMVNRTIDKNAVPIIYSVKTPIQLKSAMFSNMRDVLSTRDIDLLSDSQDATDYLIKNYEYYKIEDDGLKRRLMNPYVQTDLLVYESINLEQIVTQGFVNLKEKSGKRKDRVMSLAYGLWYAKLLEDEYINKKEDNSILDYIYML